MSVQDPLAFVRNLKAVFDDAWDDEAVREQLMNDPRTVLAAHGIELPATVEVETEPTDPEKETRDAPRSLSGIVARWDRMVEKGKVEIIVPASRPDGLGTRDLTDQELERVSGGSGFDTWPDDFWNWLSQPSSGPNDG